jgi:hypothetical protein
LKINSFEFATFGAFITFARGRGITILADIKKISITESGTKNGNGFFDKL